VNKDQNLLTIKNLTIDYEVNSGTVHAVDNLNLEIGYGETLGFVGETGAGKTTTALGILKLLQEPRGRIVSGEIYFEGENLLDKSKGEMRNIRGSQISMIFQDPMTSLDPVMPVKKQIAEVIKLHNSISNKEANKKAKEMLETVGIRKERADDYPHQFSGGMKQRVIIAIALACNPKLLIADEPTTALDVTIQAQVLELMKDLKEKFDTSIILITHDLGIVADLCDNVAIMYAGSIVEYGDIDSIYNNPLQPYTVGLFNSIPDLDTEKKELQVIKGTLPDPTNLPSGCRFHPRCSKVFDKCSRVETSKIEVEPGHFVNCHLYNDNK